MQTGSSRRRLTRFISTGVAVVAVTGGMAAGSAQAVASPAGAAGSSSSPTINITQAPFNLILPNAQVGKSNRALRGPDHVTAFHGFSSFQSIKIESKGFDLEGRIHGRLRSHNFEKLYQVYNLPKSSGWKLWVLDYKQDSSQSVLKETVNRAQLVDVNIDLKFKVSAAELKNVSTLRVGFETLRLELNGTTKDFTVVNGASGSAKDQNGNNVDVDFEEV